MNGFDLFFFHTHSWLKPLFTDVRKLLSGFFWDCLPRLSILCLNTAILHSHQIFLTCCSDVTDISEGFSILWNIAKGFELTAEQNTVTLKVSVFCSAVSSTVKVYAKRVMVSLYFDFFASCYLLRLWMQYSRMGFLCRWALKAFITYPMRPVSVVSFSSPVLLAFAHPLTPTAS